MHEVKQFKQSQFTAQKLTVNRVEFNLRNVIGIDIEMRFLIAVPLDYFGTIGLICYF